MSCKQTDLLATLLLVLCGGACWSFLLYQLYHDLVPPMVS